MSDLPMSALRPMRVSPEERAMKVGRERESGTCVARPSEGVRAPHGEDVCVRGWGNLITVGRHGRYGGFNVEYRIRCYTSTDLTFNQNSKRSKW